jgi:hypothetical protein
MSSDEDVTMPGILYLRFAPDGRCAELEKLGTPRPEGRLLPRTGAF